MPVLLQLTQHNIDQMQYASPTGGFVRSDELDNAEIQPGHVIRSKGAWQVVLGVSAMDPIVVRLRGPSGLSCEELLLLRGTAQEARDDVLFDVPAAPRSVKASPCNDLGTSRT
jgi:hypothetical protein